MTTTITLYAAPDSHLDPLGVQFVSDRLAVAGQGLHNPGWSHEVIVWGNKPNTDPTKRFCMFDGQPGLPVGEGKYVDPYGKGTDDAITVTLSTSGGSIGIVGKVTVGETVTLEFPDGTTKQYVITPRYLADPVLIPA